MSKITKSARGEQCQVRIPWVCNRDPETVVFAHLNGGGMGMKHLDCEGAYCCSACHDVVDGRVDSRFTRLEIENDFHWGCVRTRAILVEKGLLICR
jgi:hypothetical protein